MNYIQIIVFMKKKCLYFLSYLDFRLIVGLSILITTNITLSQGPSDINNWSLIWSDEFNDGTINTTMWKVEPEFDHWGANPNIVAIDDNVNESGGNLILTHKGFGPLLEMILRETKLPAK